jgi:anti-sigma factor RsiW
VTDTFEQLSCQELVELVTDYLEGALSADERRRFDEHLDTCDGCRTYVRQLEQTIRATGELRADSLSPEAEQTLLQAFRDWKGAR